MQPLAVHFLAPGSNDYVSSLRSIIEAADDIDDFISNWFISLTGSLTFLRGTDPASESSPCLVVAVRNSDVDIAELYFSLESLKARYPSVKPIDSFIHGFDSAGRCILDDEALDSFEESLGYEYHDGLHGMLGPRESLLGIALSYVLADRGEVQLSHYEPPEEIEATDPYEELSPRNIMSLSLLYQSPSITRGCTPMFGNFLFVSAAKQYSC